MWKYIIGKFISCQDGGSKVPLDYDVTITSFKYEIHQVIFNVERIAGKGSTNGPKKGSPVIFYLIETT